MTTVRRIMHVAADRFEVGDVISVPVIGEDGWETMEDAIAVKRSGENMIFCSVNCIGGDQAMNSDLTNSGGYEESGLRQTLRFKVLPRISKQFVKDLTPLPSKLLIKRWSKTAFPTES